MGRIKRRHRIGFTLIEIIVIVGIVSITLPVTISLFLVILQQQIRLFSLQQVKREGDYALSVMRSIVYQNGIKVVADNSLVDRCPVYPTPTPANTSFNFLDKNGKLFTYRMVPMTNDVGNPIYRLSYDRTEYLTPYPSPTIFLTSPQVSIENFSLGCYRTNSFSPPIVNYSFTVVKRGSFIEAKSLQYNGEFRMRGY